MKFSLNKNFYSLFLGSIIGLSAGLIASYFTGTIIVKRVMYQIYTEISQLESIKELSKETAEKMTTALQDSVYKEHTNNYHPPDFKENNNKEILQEI